jgi:hypothetical protein
MGDQDLKQTIEQIRLLTEARRRQAASDKVSSKPAPGAAAGGTSSGAVERDAPRPRAVSRQAEPSAPPGDEADVRTMPRSDVSDVCQALCAFVSEAGLSPKTVPALLAAAAAASGRRPASFFPMSGVELGRRLGKPDLSEQGYARRWSRAWPLLHSEQRRTGLTLVERRRGTTDPATKRKRCEEYRVPLTQYLLDVMALSGRFAGKGIRRSEQFERAAHRVIARLPHDYGK